MLGDRDPRRGVIGDEPLPRIELAQRGRRGDGEGEGELNRKPLSAAGNPDPPQVLAPPQVVPPADRLAGPRPGEQLERLAAGAGARCEVGEVGVGTASLALFDHRSGIRFPQAGYVTQAYPDRRAL